MPMGTAQTAVEWRRPGNAQTPVEQTRPGVAQAVADKKSPGTAQAVIIHNTDTRPETGEAGRRTADESAIGERRRAMEYSARLFPDTWRRRHRRWPSDGEKIGERVGFLCCAPAAVDLRARDNIGCCIEKKRSESIQVCCRTEEQTRAWAA
jgi:hypothetical protein